MKIITVVFGLLFFISLHIPSYGENITIDVSQPYASGKENLPFDWEERDTIFFSNGLQVESFSFLNPGWWMSSYPACAIQFIDSSHKNISFRYSEKLSKYDCDVPEDEEVIKYTTTEGSTDTDALKVTAFPVSLFPADSIYRRDSTRTCIGKPFLQSNEVQDSQFAPYTENMILNYNTIMYITLRDNSHMMFQLCEPKLFTTEVTWGPEQKTSTVTYLSAIKFAWAVDSVGNGIFDPPTPVKVKPATINAKTKQTTIIAVPSGLKIDIPQAKGIPVYASVYDGKGRCFVKPKVLNKSIIACPRLPAGVYLVTVSTPDMDVTRKYIQF